MKVFITGIAGFLGSHLAKSLIADGYEVSGCDNLVGGYKDNVPEKAGFVKADCNDLEEMKRCLEGVDVVYHCAALAYEGLSVFSPHLVTQSIYGATASVASAAISNGVKRFVYCSSMARYGTNKVPFTENMKPNPQDPYGISKVASENLLKNLCEVHGMKLVIAVPHNIYGPGQKYDDPYRNVASIFVNRMLQGKQPIIFGDGSQKRSFSYISDCVEPLKRMGVQSNVVGETVNIGPDENFITVLELAKKLACIIGFKLNPIFVPERPQEIQFASCSAEKARSLLDYETNVVLGDGLTKLVSWIKKRGFKSFDYYLGLEIISDRTPKTWTQKSM